MKFVMIGLDGPDGSELRKRLRPSHLERLERLTVEKKLIVAGPFADKSGSLIIFEAGSLEEAVAWGRGRPVCFRRGLFPL